MNSEPKKVPGPQQPGIFRPRAAIAFPAEGQTVSPTFDTNGTFAELASVLTLTLTRGTDTYLPTNFQRDDPTRTWTAHFDNIPCGNNYALTIEAGSVEPPQTKVIHVCVGIIRMEYQFGLQQKTVPNPSVDLVYALGDVPVLSADNDCKPTRPFKLLTSFHPDPGPVRVRAIHDESATSLSFNGVPCTAALCGPVPDQMGSKTYLFEFKLLKKDGMHTLEFQFAGRVARCKIEVRPNQ